MKRKHGDLDGLRKFAGSLKLKVVLGEENRFRKTKIAHGAVGVITLGLHFRDIEDVQFAAQNLAHELGHYLVAPKGRRHHVDYGIRDNSRFADQDESRAIFIESYLLSHFGFKPRTNFNHRTDEDVKWWKEIGKPRIETLLDVLA